MRKLFLAILGILVITTVLSAQDVKPTPPSADDEVVRISTNLIQLDVTVTDKKGKVVHGLTRDDFEIYENGEKQNISNFSFISGGRKQAPGPANSNDVKRPADGVEAPMNPPVVKPEGVRRTIALVVDDLSLSYESMNLVRRSLKKFVDEQMQEGDLVTILRVGAGSGVLQQFTSDKRLLYASIDRVRFNPLGRGRISAFEQITDIPESLKDQTKSEESKVADQQFKDSFKDYQENAFGSGTLAALRYIISAMNELPGRKSVVLFSDGINIFQRDEHGFAQSGSAENAFRILIDYANRSSVVFYTFDARTLQNPEPSAADSLSLPQRVIPRNNTSRAMEVSQERGKELTNTQAGLDYLAKETGGFLIKNQNDLNVGLQKVLEDQSYYLLGYEPDTDTFDAKTRRYNKLEIKVKREGFDVRYRSGFFNLTDDAVKPKDETKAKVRSLEHVITTPFLSTNIAVRLNTIFGNNNSGNFVTALLNINTQDLKFTDASDGVKRAELEVLAMSFGVDGVPIDKFSKTLRFDIKPDVYRQVLKTGFLSYFTFPLKNPGGYQFRVAVRDTQTGMLGSASQFIEIPDLKKNRLTLSGVVLENFSPEQWTRFAAQERKSPTAKEGTVVDPTDPMNDTSHRRFGRNSVLRYGFEVYNAKLNSSGRPSLSTRIRVYRDGQLLLDGQELRLEIGEQSDMRRVQTGGAMNLPGEMVPGEYILQIIVTDNSDKKAVATQSVPFEIFG